MERAEWLLALLGAPDEAGLFSDRLDRVRVQKALFVVGEVLEPSPFYDFTPYHYGPFDSQVYRDAEDFASQGLVEEIPEDGGRYTSYQITEEGQKRVREEIVPGMSPEWLSYLLRVRKWALEHSFNTLVRQIYAKWPHMRVRSRFAE